jgi:leucyl-tRNA synthetase
LWEHLGEKSDLLRAPWPKFDEALAREEQIEIPVQINGKLRAVVTVEAAANEDAVRDAALADEKIAALISGKEVVRIIVVPRKLINIVVK